VAAYLVEDPTVTRRFDKQRDWLALVDPESGRLTRVASITKNIRGAPHIRGVAVSNDGSYLAACGYSDDGGWAMVASPRHRSVLWQGAPGTSSGSSVFTDLCFCPTDDTLYVWARNGTLLAYAPDTGALVGEWLPRGEFAYREAGTVLAVSPDGYLIALGEAPVGRICLWDVRSRKRLVVWETEEDTIVALAFSPDSQRLASLATEQVQIKIWNLAPLGVGDRE
jgi:WD40 repeat protein